MSTGGSQPSQPFRPPVQPTGGLPPRSERKRVGELLVESGYVSEADVAEALIEAKRTGQFVGQVLIHAGKITREQLGQALGQQYDTKYVSLSKMEIDPAILEILPEEFIRLKKVLPITKEGGRLVVAMVNPSDRPVIDEITFMTGMRPQTVVTTHFEFQEAFNKYLGDRSSNNLIEEISNAAAANQEMSQNDLLRQQREAELLDTTNPLAKLVGSIIEEGIERNASDIHIEPRLKKYVVRFRVDGILKTILDVPQNMENSFVTRIKVMARMDIAEHRRPQDGRIVIKSKGTEYNLRVNTLPVTDGREKIVIRILRPFKHVVDFKDLGFSVDEIEKIEQLYKAPHGIVLVCGPTGSGKTTTLYTVLNKINDEMRNISTVEDPVELTIEGLNQSQVNPKADYTFANSMRALMRQDPDVIMVGEIRDYETLEAAIHAALTGHLVFSTIHSNTAATTITRMIEMGAAANLVSSALVGVVAQRLVRRICGYCKQSYDASDAEKKVLFPFDPIKQGEPLTLYNAKGCDLCGHSGYSGRVGLYEILSIDREIRHLISASASDMEIEDAAMAAGMKNLTDSARTKVLMGVTTLKEVTRVLGSHLNG